MSLFPRSSLKALMALALFGFMVAGVTLLPPNAARSGGISSSDVQNGCTCHSGSADPSVTAALEGLPGLYEADTTYRLNISFSGGPTPGGSNQGGFNLQASSGTLSSLDNTVGERSDGSLSHTSAGNDQRSWQVEWKAPATTDETVDFRLVVNSVDGDGSNDGQDRWNELEVSVPGARPDAALDQLEVTGDLQPDTPVNFTLRVFNAGNRNLTGVAALARVLHNDSQVWNDTLLVGDLNLSATRYLGGSWPGGEAGSYTLEVSVQVAGDTNSSNDRVAQSLQVAMNVTDVGVGLESVSGPLREMTPLTLRGQVTNHGRHELNGVDLELAIYREGLLQTTLHQNRSRLAPGQTLTVNWTWSGGEAGNYTFTMLSTLADDEPANDQASISLNVIENVTEVGVRLIGVASQVEADQALGFMVGLENRGNLELAGVLVTVEVRQAQDPVWSVNRTVADLSPGSNTSLAFSWPGGAAGNYTLQAHVEVAHDDNDSNDQDTATVKVLARPALADHEVTVDGFSFVPVTLTIKVGESVRWSWTDAPMAHNVAQTVDGVSNSYLAGGFRSGEAATTVDLTHTFDTPGTYHYICEPHAGLGMRGTIIVEAAGPTGGGDDDDTGGDDSPGFGLVALVVAGLMGLLVSHHHRR